MVVQPNSSRVSRQLEGAGDPSASSAERGDAAASGAIHRGTPRRVKAVVPAAMAQSGLTWWTAPSSAEARRFSLWRRHCHWLAPRTRLLAAAFGACRCWGVDADCASCGGHGAPGWQTPAP